MKAPLRALWALLPVLAVFPVEAAPIIAEFQADNKDTTVDDDGASSDWIEIYNPDNTDVNLAGMALTDDPALPQKWLFPAVSIQARGRLLVWASVKNRTNPAAPLHTNFDLAAGGEYLALVAANGVTKLSEFNTFPPQPPDRSYGSAYEGTGTQTLLAAGAPCKWMVPTGEMSLWQSPGFDDISWNLANSGIGYDATPPGTVDYGPLLGANGDVRPAMFGTNASCYIRLPFNFTGFPGDVTSLKLRMKFDDGFVAFLNGTQLNPPSRTDSNGPAVLPLAYNSAATAARSDASAVTFTTFDISGQKSLLANGFNLLAIQALNQSPTSSDLIIVPEIDVTVVNTTGPLRTGFFAVPTPDAAGTLPPVDGFVEEVDFSVKRGIYTTAQTVALTCATPGAQIRFTINGSKPTATTGTPYAGALSISVSTVVRAGAFKTGWEPAPLKTHTYIFGASAKTQPAAPPGYPTQWGNEYDFINGTGLTGPAVPADYRMDPGITNHATYGPLIVDAITNTLPIVCLSGNVTDIFDSNTGIYSNGRITPGLEIATSMEYFDPHSTENWQEDAGLRMHGGDAPIEHPKKPFRIYFRKEYGNGRLRHSLFPGSPVDSFDKLQFRPLGHDSWSVPFGSGTNSLARHAMFCRDRFLRQTEFDMGRLAPYGKYVHLFINGLYWGFYDLHEVQSKEYWADHKGGAEEDWDVVEHTNISNPLVDPVDGSDAAMNAALQLVNPASNAALQSTYDALAQYIDYDEFIDNCLVQMWGGQNDWMGPVFRGIPNVNLTDASRFFNKNWQAARRSRGPGPGKFFWQTWDAEISMGQSLFSGTAPMRVTDFNHTLIGSPAGEPIAHVNGGPGPAALLWYALRKNNPTFRLKVADRLQKHFFNGGAMTTANNLARLQTFRNLLDLPVVAESARWGDVNSGDPTVVTFNRDDHWRDEMNWMRDTYIAGRNQTVINQMAAIGLWPTVTAPSLSQFGGAVPSGYQLSMSHANGAGSTIYYTLDGSDPMGSGGGLTLLGPSAGTIAQYKVPTADYPGNIWKSITPPSDINSWAQGPVGFGFDVNATFAPHIATTVTGMQNVNTTLYVRIPFSVTAEQKNAMSNLTLRLKYDDGAILFLNGSGSLVPRYNASAASPTWNMAATATRLDTDAVTYQTIDLTAEIGRLNVGSSNLLAIQALNRAPADDDGDFLCVPELVASMGATNPPSASAVAYTSPVTLPQSRTVKARVLKSGVWSPLVETSFIVGQPASASNLVISEFSYNPIASATEILAGYTDQMFEWMELTNISAGTVELTGCRFDDGITFDFSTNSSVQSIAAGQRIIIVSNAAAFAARHPGVPLAGVFQQASNLSNNGERLELVAANGSHIFDFNYDDAAPWPTTPDGAGFTLVLINPAGAPNPAIPANWRASFAQGGTPRSSDADSYTAWALRNGISGGMGVDPDGNGLTNLAEYGLGILPRADETDGIFSAKFETVTVDNIPGTYLVLRFRRNAFADDVRVTPEMSPTMATWTAMTDSVPPTTSNPDGTEDLAYRSAQPVSAASRVYVRINVTTR